MKLAYVKDKDVLAAVIQNGGRLLSDQCDEDGTHIYTVDVSNVCLTLFDNGQILKSFSRERPVLTF